MANSQPSRKHETSFEAISKFRFCLCSSIAGRHQVILATHDANVVVNGDADQVIVLKADADCGSIALQGAIEDPSVKEAIVSILDGGREAFALRKAKYGF